jgi:hypothetical protein
VGNRQVSTGTAEAIALPKELRSDLGNDRKRIREKLKNPLLMLHILEAEPYGTFAAFGVSFPGSSAGLGETVKLKINTVYEHRYLLDS